MHCEYLDPSINDECVYETVQKAIKTFVDVQGEIKYRLDTKTPATPMTEEQLSSIDYLCEVFIDPIDQLASILPCQNCTVYKRK